MGGYYAYGAYFGEKTPPPRLAPADTVYTLARTNASGDGVLVGIPAGSQLRLITKSGDRSNVEYRGLQFELPDTFLTRDLDVVDQIRAEPRDRPRPGRRPIPTKHRHRPQIRKPKASGPCSPRATRESIWNTASLRLS